MTIQRAYFQDFNKVIELYKSKTIEQLRTIRPKWTYPKDSESMLNSALKLDENEYSIFLVDLKTLVQKSEFIGMSITDLFTGGSRNDRRVALILYRWENEMFVDPPVVDVFNRSNNTLSFSDGQHRTKTAFFLGHTKIPIAVYNDSIENVKKIIDLRPV